MNKRLKHGDAKERVLQAAEELFSRKPPEQVGFRELATHAGVSLSATHYHFGSRERLIEEIFHRRARPMVAQREEALQKLIDEGRELDLAGILDAFVRAALDVTRGEKEDLFNRLRSRLAMGDEDYARRLIRDAFDDNDRLYLAAIQKAVPHLDEETLLYRFNFFVGAMVYTMCDSGQLSGWARGSISNQNREVTIKHFVAAHTALFKADLPDVAAG